MYEFTCYVLLIIAALLWTFAGVPQLLRTYKTKKVSDISSLMTLLCACAFFTFELSHLLSRDYFNVIIYIIPSLVSWSLCFYVHKYKYQEVKNKMQYTQRVYHEHEKINRIKSSVTYWNTLSVRQQELILDQSGW